MNKTFDNVSDALDYIDKLAKQKKVGRLSCKLIEGVYDKRGLLEEGLYEWTVRQ